MARRLSIGEYLLDQLHRHGVRHVFGVPGDYVLGFYKLIEHSRVKHVGMTREDAAGFAADAYARVEGMGAAVVTYCVGGFSITNPIAGAYAEKSPVIVVSGAFQAWRQLGSLSNLRDTDYGKILTAKLLAFGVLIITAAFSREIVNRRFRSPRPAPAPAPPPRVPVAAAGGPPLPPDAGRDEGGGDGIDDDDDEAAEDAWEMRNLRRHVGLGVPHIRPLPRRTRVVVVPGPRLQLRATAGRGGKISGMRASTPRQ